MKAKVLVLAFKSDWLYPSYQSREIAKQLKMRNLDATYCEIKSTYGHDAFLLEVEDQHNLIVPFLDRVTSYVNGKKHTPKTKG